MTEQDIRKAIREEMAAYFSPWLDTKHAEAYAAGSRDSLLRLREQGLQRYKVGGKYLYKKSDIDRAITQK